jgi:hypothetical protein
MRSEVDPVKRIRRPRAQARNAGTAGVIIKRFTRQWHTLKDKGRERKLLVDYVLGQLEREGINDWTRRQVSLYLSRDRKRLIRLMKEQKHYGIYKPNFLEFASVNFPSSVPLNSPIISCAESSLPPVDVCQWEVEQTLSRDWRSGEELDSWLFE